MLEVFITLVYQARTKKKNKKQSVKKEPRPVIVKEYKVDALGLSKRD